MIHPKIIDRPLAALVARLPRWLDGFMNFVSDVASPLVLMAVIVGMIIMGLLSGNEMIVKATLVVLLFSPLAEVLKLISRRSRPETLYVENMKLKTYSFPSGHSYVSALVFGFLATVIASETSFETLAITVSIVATGLVGISRVYLGAHFPSDVLAGWLLGGLTQYLIWTNVGL